MMKNATRAMTGAMGTFVGLAGIEYGIGETLQGNTVPSGIMFPSWPGSEFFSIVAGEPAMTIIPNLLITGILAILVSLTFIGWATVFVQRKNGALVLIVLSIVLLLVGGGFGPPITGLIIGAATTQINRPLTWWHSIFPVGIRRFLIKLWPWSLISCVIAWLLLFPGSSILAYFFGLNNPTLIPILFLVALGLLLFTIFTGYVNDSSR